MDTDLLAAGSTVTKALLYPATLAAAGGAFFVVLFRRDLELPELAAVGRFVLALAIAAILLSLLRLVLLVVSLGGGMAAIQDWFLVQLVFRGGEGLAFVLRLGGLVLLPFAWAQGVQMRTLAVAGAAAAALSFVVTGHTSSVGGLAPKLLLAIHLLAIAFWLGALWPLRKLAVGTDLPRIAAVMKRFGDLAAYGVPALLLAGAALLWIMLGSPFAVLESTYGQLLFAKVMLFAALLGIAAFNKFRLTPRLAAGRPAALRSFQRSIAAEITLVLAILVATAAFTTVVGPPALE